MYAHLKTAALAAGLFVSGTAHAAVVGGDVTFVNKNETGQFVELDSSQNFAVGRNHFDTNDLYAFNEKQGVTLGSDLALDGGVVVAAGTTVSSHYVFFDAEKPRHQKGWVDFDGAILGVATTPTLLGNSDFLGAESVTYVGANLRGLERRDTATIDTILPNRLFVDWRAANPGDYLRVVTLDVVETPLPASALLLLGGLAGLYGARRRG